MTSPHTSLVPLYANKTLLFRFIKCNGWAKRTSNGRMLGYWPGSAVHQRATLANPRFEDFEYVSFYGGNSGDRSEEEDALLA